MAGLKKLLNWKWNNMSDPTVPNRHIRWEWQIPYVIEMGGSIFGKSGFSAHVWTPLWGMSFITDVGCGRSIKVGFRNWFFYFVFNWGHSVEIYLGFSELKYMEWRLRKLRNKVG